MPHAGTVCLKKGCQMSYKEYSIKEIIEKIARNEVYLPAIQRKFVWECDQIESLFDSIMRGYPIGTFLFWFVSGDEKHNYTFYKFIQEYHERDNFRHEIAPKPELRDEIIGVLDGQQRLSSMFTALQGTYAYKKPYGKWKNNKAFPKRKFYLNLLREDVQSDDEDFVYEFKFLTDEEAKKVDENHLWFLVREVLSWGKDPEKPTDEYYDDLLERSDLGDGVKAAIKQKQCRNLIKRMLRGLHRRLVVDELISYYNIEEQDLDEILDIFVRVNSGGTFLSKSDLLFSTIVANWQDAREEIEELLEAINKKGEGFRFDNDLVMRACLVLTDSPVLFKVKSFRKENMDRVMKGWGDIEASIERTVDLLVEFGFNGENLTSLNAVIPITYYLMKGGSTDEASKNELRKYLIHVLLKRTFGGQSDRVLSNIRGALNVLKMKSFSFEDMMQTTELPRDKTLGIVEKDIKEILEYRKGPYTFMVLSLLYPNLKFGQVRFHQDHIHPESAFTDAKLRRYGIPEENWEEWKMMKDQLPNLQLMEGQENKRKNKMPFDDWLDGNDSKGNPNVPDRDKFLDDNYIQRTVSFDFKDFERFFEARKQVLESRIRKLLLSQGR